MATSFELRGTKAMKRKIERIAREFPNRVERSLRVEAELVMTDSKKNYVPVDLGALRDSGFVGNVERRGEELSVTLAFGGPTAPYAIIQHERPDFVHPVGSWKYLEIPLNQAIPGMARRIAASLRLRDDRGRFISGSAA
jgi:hypothetical protein